MVQMTSPSPMTFSMAVRWHVQLLLEQQQLSQKDLARAIHRSPSSVSQLLGGQRRRDDLDVWRDIAQHLGRHLSVLLTEAEQSFTTSQLRQPSKLRPTSAATTTPTPTTGVGDGSAAAFQADGGGPLDRRAFLSFLDDPELDRLLRTRFEATFTRYFTEWVERLSVANGVSPFRPRPPAPRRAVRPAKGNKAAR